MTQVTLDPQRWADLQIFDESERTALLQLVVSNTSKLIEGIAAAIDGDDLASVAALAHKGANEVLAVGANELGQAFRELEIAVRSGGRERAIELGDRAQEVWPATRDAIETLVSPALRSDRSGRPATRLRARDRRGIDVREPRHRHARVELRVREAAVDALDRGDVGIVAPMSDLDVRLAGKAAIRGIGPDPNGLAAVGDREQRFEPRVRVDLDRLLLAI
jgi:HPt (histidine-containing phosphotransfer) domain-containing protein